MAPGLDQEWCGQQEQSCCGTPDLPPALHTDFAAEAPEKGTKGAPLEKTLLGYPLVHLMPLRMQLLIDIATEKLERNKMRKNRNYYFCLWTILKTKTKEEKKPQQNQQEISKINFYYK